MIRSVKLLSQHCSVTECESQVWDPGLFSLLNSCSVVWILFVLGYCTGQWESGCVATSFFAVGHLYTSENWFPSFFLSQQKRPSSFPSSGEPSIIFLILFAQSASSLSLPWPLLPNLKHAWFCVCPIEQRDKLSSCPTFCSSFFKMGVPEEVLSFYLLPISNSALCHFFPHQSQSCSCSL